MKFQTGVFFTEMPKVIRNADVAVLSAVHAFTYELTYFIYNLCHLALQIDLVLLATDLRFLPRINISLCSKHFN